MGTLGGSAVILLIVLVAGLIAYIGDRVGHQVGRKRLTLFGLRPKYTSTIVAVGTGMMIALVVTLATLLASGYARAAFFHLSEINNQVNELQAKQNALEKQVRENGIVINRGSLLYNQFLIITPQQSHKTQSESLAAFFGAVVASANRNYVAAGLKAFKGKAADAEIARKLEAVLADQKVQGALLRGPVLLVAIADQNLFPGDTIQFTFAPYPDVPIFRNRQSIASVEVDGGTSIVPNVAYGQLAAEIQASAVEAGMPVYFANAFAGPTPAQTAALQRAIKTGRGRFYIIARAARDVYPHTGGVPVSFQLSRSQR